MDIFIKKTIVDILKNHENVLKISIRQKAKYEGWLKFELASYLEQYGMENVEVESKGHFKRERVVNTKKTLSLPSLSSP